MRGSESGITPHLGYEKKRSCRTKVKLKKNFVRRRGFYIEISLMSIFRYEPLNVPNPCRFPYEKAHPVLTRKDKRFILSHTP